MVCPKCGKMLANYITQCPKCGYQFEEESSMIQPEPNLIVTTSNFIDGYRVVTYCGIVSGECAIGTDAITELFAGAADAFGTQSVAYSSKIGQAKATALRKLKKNAVKMGANAVISISIELVSTPNNMFIASACGTAVIIQKPN